MKKVMIFVLICYSLILLVMVYFSNVNSLISDLTGLVVGDSKEENIDSDLPFLVYIENPKNDSYYINFSQDAMVSLSAFSNRENIESWWYEIYDARGKLLYKSNASFSLPQRIGVFKGVNNLTVYAKDSNGEISFTQELFNVVMPNTSPRFNGLENEYFICEDDRAEIKFNVADSEEDELFFSLYPSGSFFVYPFYVSRGRVSNEVSLVSEILNKSKLGIHNLAVAVSDNHYVDVKNIKIEVIEINHAPIFDEPGAKTLLDSGPESNFYYLPNVFDIEEGNLTNSSNINFSLSFSNEASFFTIDQKTGLINWSANSDYIGVHNISICVTDSSINVSNLKNYYCESNGSARTACHNLSFVITKFDRPPIFLSSAPDYRSLIIENVSDRAIEFNATFYDPDKNLADARWIVNGQEMTIERAREKTNVSLKFGCEHSGLNLVTLEINDGLLNNSLNWRILINDSSCSSTNETFISSNWSEFEDKKNIIKFGCSEIWACGEWATCQNVEKSFSRGVLPSYDKYYLLDMCDYFGFKGELCGYQIRQCADLNYCGTNFSEPTNIQSCYYSERPSCFDGLRNCHDGYCELLADCGGACSPCANCFDGIMNQGEDGADCGGPCLRKCTSDELDKGIEKTSYLIWGICIILLALFMFVMIKIFKIIKMRRDIKNLEWKSLVAEKI